MDASLQGRQIDRNEANLDKAEICNLLNNYSRIFMQKLTPFIESLIKKCKDKPGRVIFPEGDDPRVIEAAKILLSWGVAREIKLISTTGSVSIGSNDARISSSSSKDPTIIKGARADYEKNLLSRNKNMTPDQLDRQAESPLVQAGTMLSHNQADCVIAGCVATTSDVIRASISTVGLASGIRTVSGSFIMDRSSEKSNETLIFADCGVVIEPSVDQLVDIAKSSAETFEKLTDHPPVIAFLSFSTKGSADHPSAEKMRMAAQKFKEKYPHLESDGELQFDAAFVAEVGLRKAPNSKIPGRANCFIFPNLDAGNIAYKITHRLGGFGAYGPILQGLAKPYSDLSRGASAEDIAISALINILRSC